MGRCTSVSKNVWSKSILSSKILWVGCSFVNGMELPDKKVQRFSARVCKNFGQLEWNEGKVGAGNDYIQRYGKKINSIPAFMRSAMAYGMDKIPSNYIPILRNKYNFHNRYEKVKGVLKNPSEELPKA